MAAKKVDEKKTLKYAVAFYFCTSGKINFMLGNKVRGSECRYRDRQ